MRGYPQNILTAQRNDKPGIFGRVEPSKAHVNYVTRGIQGLEVSEPHLELSRYRYTKAALSRTATFAGLANLLILESERNCHYQNRKVPIREGVARSAVIMRISPHWPRAAEAVKRLRLVSCDYCSYSTNENHAD